MSGFAGAGLPDTFPGYVGNFPMNKIIGGWVLLAIIAASMSTGDGAILAMGTVLYALYYILYT